MPCRRGAAPLWLLVVLLSGCGGGGIGPEPDYDPGVTTADFVAGVHNPFFPLPKGASWRYEADGGHTVIEVVVQNETRSIMGVNATVVRDTESEDGDVVEDTFDF